MTHNNDKDITLLLGKKLLMGWSMLNNVCKDCKIVPLVENKKDNIILCVSCERQLKRDENGEILDEKKSTPSNNSSSSSSSSTTTPSSSNTSTPIPTTTTITNITKPLQQQHTTTIKNDTKQIDMKYYDDYFDDYDEDDTPLTEEEKIAIEKRLKKSDEFSSKMGEFLLKGWSLLSDSCPNNECYGVPLMKDREKKFYCVSCKMSGLEIDDLIQKLPLTTSTESPTTSPTATTSTNTTTTTTTTTNPIIEKQQIIELQPPQQQQQQQQQPHLIRSTNTTTNTPITVENITPIKNTLTNNSTFSPPYPEPEQKKQRMTGTTPQKLNNGSNNQSFLSTSSVNNILILNDEIQELPDFTDNTLSILFEKLKDAQNQLVTTNNIHYCSLIREYTSTISSLLELKKHWTM
ncbi:hypothetical protein ACTFIY_000512 [Dictyostelium cf. discoideum]